MFVLQNNTVTYSQLANVSIHIGCTSCEALTLGYGMVCEYVG